MDSVLQLLNKCGLGCHIGNVFAGILAYADDLILLSSSLICMQIMLDVCSETLTNMVLQFNIDKCIAVVFGKFSGKSSCKNSIPHDNVLLWSADLHYLGIQFKAGLNIGIDISERSRKFIGSVVSILRGRIAGFNDLYINIVKSKCMQILFYGVDVLCLQGQELAKMSVVWNTAFRWVLGVRRNDRMRNHLKNCGTMSFAYLLDLRFLLFLFSLKGESTQLLSRLSCVFFNSDIFKSLLSKYDVLSFDNIP